MASPGYQEGWPRPPAEHTVTPTAPNAPNDDMPSTHEATAKIFSLTPLCRIKLLDCAFCGLTLLLTGMA